MHHTTQALIFDFDGTLVLTERVHLIAWTEVADELGLPLPDDFEAHCAGRLDRHIARDLAELWKTDRHENPLTPDALRALKNRHYALHVAELPPWVPGARDAIRHWSKTYRIALATNAHHEEVRRILKYEGLWDSFDVIRTIEDVSRPKPDPQVYQLAIEGLGMPVECCWAFEDSLTGTAAALAAGLRVIGLTTSLTPAMLSGAHCHIADFSDLPKIERWLNNGGEVIPPK